MRKTIKSFVLLILWTGYMQVSLAQDRFLPESPQDWVLAKNYLASYLLFKDGELSEKLFTDAEINEVLAQRASRYVESETCKDVACFLSAFKWNDQEAEAVSKFAVDAFEKNKNLRDLVQSKLLISSAYGVAADVVAVDYFEKAIRQDMKYMNFVIDVYAGGKKPNYPNIDSISFDITKKSFIALLKDVRQDILKDCDAPFQSAFMTMLTAVRLLEVNERMDAAMLEPMMEGENAGAVAAIKKTNFKNYPYSLLLVLGAGPSVYGQPISPGGMLRARMAARAYFDKQAPFIVLSGGRVHPYKTLYIEALEMKRYLVENLGVPHDAIIVDPHARHTTTNMRNTARIMLNYSFPKDQFAIVTSSQSHIDAVINMADRCIKELGYVPYELGKRTSDVVVEFKPRKEAMTIDPDEPLDP